jgi:EmrB/QacA subfamily drug resistance transporter
MQKKLHRLEQIDPSARTIRDLAPTLIAIIVGIFMVILDTTAVNVAVPKLAEDFNASLSVVQWTLTGYTLAQAAVIPLAGWMSDRFGARRIFIICIILFTLGSLLCAFATSATQLIVFRVLQGLAGGMVMPLAMTMIFRLSPREKVGSIMGIMGMPILLAPATGPIVSGYLVDYVSWHWIFLINLPVGILAVFLALRFIPKFQPHESTDFDILGVILGPLAFALLCYGISEGSASWTSTETLIGLIGGGAALISFIIVELLRRKQPLLELRVFKSFSFSRGILVQWLMQFVMFGVIFLIPFYMQTEMGKSAFEAGMWTLPQALTAALFMPLGGKLYDKIGVRPLVVIGLTWVAIGSFMLSNVTSTDPASAFLVPRILFGAGMGMAFLSMNTFLLQSAPAQLVSRVTSLTNSMQQVVTSLSVALITTILFHVAEPVMDINKETKQVLVHPAPAAFHDTYLILMWIAIAGIVIGFTLRRVRMDSPNNDSDKPAALAEL